jgi:hypothetical protein
MQIAEHDRFASSQHPQTNCEEASEAAIRES